MRIDRCPFFFKVLPLPPGGGARSTIAEAADNPAGSRPRRNSLVDFLWQWISPRRFRVEFFSPICNFISQICNLDDSFTLS